VIIATSIATGSLVVVTFLSGTVIAALGRRPRR
jgi:hypothetical protein